MRCDLQIGGSNFGISEQILLHLWFTTDGNLHIDAGSTKATYLNFYSGTGGTLFGNGAGVLSGASVNNAGDMVLKIKLLWVLLVVYSLVVVVILQIMGRKNS
jgi:hypothetical protein